MLEFARFCVVSLLPGQLPDEAVAQPDEKDDDKLRVVQVRLVFQDVTTAEVAVHERPRFVYCLALNDVLNDVCNFASPGKQLGVQWCLRLLIANAERALDLIILAAVVVPGVAFALQDNEVDSLYNFFGFDLVHPVEHKLQTAKLWRHGVALEQSLASDSVLEPSGVLRQRCVVWPCPLIGSFLADGPVEHQVFISVLVLCD